MDTIGYMRVINNPNLSSDNLDDDPYIEKTYMNHLCKIDTTKDREFVGRLHKINNSIKKLSFFEGEVVVLKRRR